MSELVVPVEMSPRFRLSEFHWIVMRLRDKGYQAMLFRYGFPYGEVVVVPTSPWICALRER